MLVDINSYQEKKKKGLVKIQKVDNENYAIAISQFSSIDGSPMSPMVQGVSMTQVNNEIAEKTTELDTLNSFLNDLKKAV